MPNETKTASSVEGIAKKPIFKRWYFWLIISLILATTTGFFAIRGKQNDKSRAEQQKKEVQNQTNQPQGEASHVFDASLPSCPSDLTGLFNHEIFDLADVDFVVPLGRVDAGVHTIPTDHMYINHYGHKRIAIYAPTDMTLVSMDDKMTYQISDDKFLHDDYSIEFAPCKGLSLYLNHFSEIEPKIKAAFESSNHPCDDHKISFGTNATTYYKACNTQFKLEIKSGELLGYVGTFSGGETIAATGMDLGVYNLNGTAKNFANPDRYTPYNLHSACGIDLFTSNIKDTYYRKLGSLSKDQLSIIPRTGEPLCGTDMQDAKGTLAGNWFFGPPVTEGPTNTPDYLALVHDVAEFNKGTISWKGQPGNFTSTFTPLHSGTVDREFSEITPGEQIYCYQEQVPDLGIIDANGKPKASNPMKYLIQLIDATHLKIERQSGTCLSTSSSGTGAWQFSNPIIYER